MMKYKCRVLWCIFVTVLSENCLAFETHTCSVQQNGQQNNAEEYKDMNIRDRLQAGVNAFLITGMPNHDLEIAINVIGADSTNSSDDVITRSGLWDTLKTTGICTLCNFLIPVWNRTRDLGIEEKKIKSLVKTICELMGQTTKVCDGAIELNYDIFTYILDHSNVSSSKACSIVFQANDCNNFIAFDETWSIKLPARDYTAEKKYKPDQELTTSQKPIKILHITDIHYDDIYKIGSNAYCDEPLCCGSNQGMASTPKEAAGHWGSYNKCDMPWHTIKTFMKEISKHDVDFVYHTGDIVNHRAWETTIKSNRKAIEKVHNILVKTFAPRNIPVYPILGNHESHPLNIFSPKDVHANMSTQWLYDLVAEQWSQWLPKSALETIRKAGYYSVLVRPGFRIIALNSNVPVTFNWWLLLNDEDPYNQLQWFSDTLHEAEKNGEIAHILTHVPIGDGDTHIKWSFEYERIIKRFSHVITAQFCGHSHADELHYFYDVKNLLQPINIIYNGGSFATYIDFNPNYKIYDVNPKSMMVENIHVWTFNLTEANLHTNKPPKWFKLYSFKEAYGLSSMSYKNMGQLLVSMTKNQTLLDIYFKNKVRAADPSLKFGCNQQCHERTICNIVTRVYGNNKICDIFINEYRQNVIIKT